VQKIPKRAKIQKSWTYSTTARQSLLPSTSPPGGPRGSDPAAGGDRRQSPAPGGHQRSTLTGPTLGCDTSLVAPVSVLASPAHSTMRTKARRACLGSAQARPTTKQTILTIYIYIYITKSNIILMSYFYWPFRCRAGPSTTQSLVPSRTTRWAENQSPA
jgi:hypothetical protein